MQAVSYWWLRPEDLAQDLTPGSCLPTERLAVLTRSSPARLRGSAQNGHLIL